VPTEQDIIRRVWLKGSDITLNTWLKGSDASLGLYDVAASAPVRYINALTDYAPLLTTDPAQKLEPAPSGAATETQRFVRYIILSYASTPRTVLAVINLLGTAHIYVDTPASTYYYRYYAKLVKTSDFSTFTDVTTESTVMSYSRGAATTAGWYDDGTFNAVLRAKASLDAGEALLLVVRGTSWASGTVNNSIGINTSNFKVFPAVLA
jgi:hypothetical protein